VLKVIDFDASPHHVYNINAVCSVEAAGYGVRVAMAGASVFLNDVQWMSILQLLGASSLCYMYLRWLPHTLPVRLPEQQHSWTTNHTAVPWQAQGADKRPSLVYTKQQLVTCSTAH
jgi:hypothetical protein